MKLSFLKIQGQKGKEKHSLSTMIEISKSKGREVLPHATLLQKVFMDMRVRYMESTHMSKAAIRSKVVVVHVYACKHIWSLLYLWGKFLFILIKNICICVSLFGFICTTSAGA